MENTPRPLPLEYSCFIKLTEHKILQPNKLLENSVVAVLRETSAATSLSVTEIVMLSAGQEGLQPAGAGAGAL